MLEAADVTFETLQNCRDHNSSEGEGLSIGDHAAQFGACKGRRRAEQIDTPLSDLFVPRLATSNETVGMGTLCRERAASDSEPGTRPASVNGFATGAHEIDVANLVLAKAVRSSSPSRWEPFAGGLKFSPALRSFCFGSGQTPCVEQERIGLPTRAVPVSPEINTSSQLFGG